MAAISHLKNIRGQLATAFGIHLVQGYTVLEEVTTPDATEPQITVIQALGDGHGAGWDGPQEMTYRGHAIDAANYHFHAGTFSKGPNDPAQGIDSWFPGGITYNGTTYVVAKLPPGVASEGNATELQGIYRCLKLPNYNAAGQQIDRHGTPVPGGANPEDYFYYSANPARVAAWLILFGRGLSPNRVDWAAWVAWRDYCEALIDWADGTTTEVVATLAWRSGGGMTVGSGGSAVKGRDTSGVDAWDSGTTTAEACPVNASNHRGIQFTISSPYGFMVGLTNATVMSGDGHSYRPLDIALYFEQGGALKVYASGDFIGTLAGGWAAGQTYRVVAEGNVWKFYRDGVAITHALSLAAPPSGALYGGIACNVQHSGVTAASFFPAATGGSTQGPRRIPRFEAHLAFTQPTSLQDALDQVCFMACSDWQETPRIRFLTPQPAVYPGQELHAAQRTIVHHFDATDAAVDNIIKRSISAYPMDVRERWNFVEGIFRDLDHPDLIEDFVTDDRPALQDDAERIISPGQVNLGNMNRSQALRVLKWLMRLRSDRVWFCELRAPADSLHVLPGDVVEVSHATYGWVKKLFLVIDATDDEEGADERSFILQEYAPNDYYYDSDHSRGQRTTAPPVPSPFKPPPVVSAVTLQETLTLQADGTVISGIRGTVTFAGYVGRQRGRVWIKPSTEGESGWERAGTALLAPHPTTGTDVFEIRGVQKISYDIKIVSEAENTTQLPFASHQTYTINVEGKLAAPDVPTGLGATMGENGMVVWTADAPTDADFAFLRVYDGTGAVVINRLDSNRWEEPPSGPSMTRAISAVNRSGRESLKSANVTFTLPSPVAPTGVSVVRKDDDFVVSWTALEGLDYQVSQNQSLILWQGKGGQFRHPGAAAGFTGTAQYFVRSVRFGVASVWVAATAAIAPPNAPQNVAVVRSGLDFVVSWTALEGLDYEVSLDQAGILWRGRGGQFRHVGGAHHFTGTAQYWVRAVRFGVPSTWVLASVTVTPPNAPGSCSLVFDGTELVVTWTASTSPDVTHYQVSDGNDALLAPAVSGLRFRFKPTWGVGTYTVRVRSVNLQEVVSVTFAQDSVTITPPAPPASATGSTDGRNVNWVLTASPSTGPLTYLVRDTFGVTLAADIGLAWKESAVWGTSTYTRRFYAMNSFGLISSTFTQATFTFTAPAPPASVVGAAAGDHLVWKLTASPTAGVVHYRVKDTGGTVLADGLGLEWREQISANVSAYTRRFYAVNAAGLESAALEVSYTVPTPGPPALTLAHVALEELLHLITPPANYPGQLEYELASQNSPSVILVGSTRDVNFIERGFSTAARLITRYARSKNLAGRVSTWVSASVTVAAPGQPALTPDTARARPEFLSVHVAPHAAVDPSRVKATILQVRASGGAWPATADGTSGTYRFAGCPKTILVPALTGGGTVEFRVAHEDEFTMSQAGGAGDHVWSITTTFTFPKFTDGSFDKDLNFLKKANWKNPIYTGGGTITWGTDFKVKWTQPIVFDGLSTQVSPTGQVTVAANAAGTTVGAGQALICVQTLGQATATTQVITVATYEAPDENSTTVHRLLFVRLANDQLGTYLGIALNPGELMDATVLIPMLTTFEARIGNALITKANIKSLAATQIDVDEFYGRIVFGDQIGSENYRPHGSTAVHTIATPTLANANATGVLNAEQTLVTKVSGGALWNCGATTDQFIAFGDFTAEWVFTANVSVGLSTTPSNGAYLNFDYGIHFSAGNGTVYESGTSRASFTCVVGDKIRIKGESGGTVLKYYKVNSAGVETLIHTSALPITYPLYAEVAIFNVGVAAGVASLTGVFTPVETFPLRWTSLIKSAYDASDNIVRTAATGSVYDAFATSFETFAGDCQLDLLAGDTATSRAVGFTAEASATDQADMAYGVAVNSFGEIQSVVGGVRTLRGTYVAGDTVSACIEGGVFKIRKGGAVVWNSGAAVAGAPFRAMAMLFHLNATVDAVYRKHGVRGAGWMADKSGWGEFSKEVQVGAYTLDDIVARAAQANDGNLQYRGNDYGLPLVHKVSAFAVDSWDASPGDLGANVRVQLCVTTPEKPDTFYNFDSVYKARVTVYNQFGEVIKSTKPFGFAGGELLLPEFAHPRRYADPETQAVYELRFRNAYGWSQPVFLKAGAQSLTMPAQVKRQHTFLSASAAAVEDNGIFVSWRQTPVAQQGVVQYRLVGETNWQDHTPRNGAGTPDPAATSSIVLSQPEGTVAGTEYEHVAADAEYDVRVYNATYGTYSNVVRVKTWPTRVVVTTLDNHGSYGLVASSTGSTAVTLRWTTQAQPALETVNLYEIWRRTVGGSWATIYSNAAAPAFPYVDNTAATATTYEYMVRNRNSDNNYQPFSNVARVTTEATANASDPSELKATVISQTRTDLTWLLNGATGTVTVEFKAATATSTPLSDAAFWSSGVTSSTQAAGTAALSITTQPDKDYYARVRVSDAGANPTNVVFFVSNPNVAIYD